MDGPTLTLQLPTAATYGRWLTDDWRRLVDLARAAEDAGVDRVAVVDHVVMGTDSSQYVWADVELDPNWPWLDPLTLLASIATSTDVIRLSTRILVAPLRPAALLAKMAATIDVLSGGRLDLGVGTGWQREEYDAEGLDFDRRGELLTETIAACRALWEHRPASHSSADISFDGVYCAPAPAQDRLPVWFGGTMHERNVRRIVELGDGWIPIMQAPLSDVADGIARLRDAAPDRTFEVQAELPIVRSSGGAPDLDATLDQVPATVAAGPTDVFMSLASLEPRPERATSTIATVGRRFAEITGR
ncbi:MAG: TIGR03619 family F420-dependent LLM class oxidoreductase [Ilumatobacteraceae bacterium]